MGYNQFEFNDGSRAALTFHCGPLLKEVLVVPKNAESFWEAVVSAGEVEGGTSVLSPTSPDGVSCRNVSTRAISGADRKSVV